MLIALPNVDGSFTVTLFLPNEGEESFQALTTTEAVYSLFERRFADAIPLMPRLGEDFFEKRQCAGVIRLAQPEHGFLTHYRVLVVSCDLNEQRDAFILGKLLQREDSFLLYLCFRILINRRCDGLSGTPTRLVSQPEESLATHTRTGIFARALDERQDRLGFLALRQSKGDVLSQLFV